MSKAPHGSGPRAIRKKVLLTVDDRRHRLRLDRERVLLEVLRDELGLLREVRSCSEGSCGACTVLVGDEARLSCRTGVSELHGLRITTAESLRSGPVGRAFARYEAFFCGECTDRQMVAAEALLRSDPRPSHRALLESIQKVVCRCGGEHLVYAAVRQAAELRQEEP